MRHSTLFATGGAMVFAGAITLSAQTPSPNQPAMNSGKTTITVTGCLKPWDNTMGMAPADPMAKPATPSDPMAKPGTTPMPGTRYVLMNAETAKPGETTKPTASPSTPMPSTAPAASAHPQASQFVVTAGTGVNLAAHVNHQVTVTGTVDNHMATADAAMAPESGAEGSKPMTAGQKATAKDWATLTATSVTMVSATCTVKS